MELRQTGAVLHGLKSAVAKSRSSRFATLAFACVALFSFGAPSLKAAPFASANVVVYRVGSGASALASGTGAAVYADEYTPAGALVQSIALPTTSSGSVNALIASGTATSEGHMTRSADGRYLVLPG